MICIGITIGISPSGALLHTIGIGTIIGIGIGVGQWKCTITSTQCTSLHIQKVTTRNKVSFKFLCQFLHGVCLLQV